MERLPHFRRPGKVQDRSASYGPPEAEDRSAAPPGRHGGGPKWRGPLPEAPIPGGFPGNGVHSAAHLDGMDLPQRPDARGPLAPRTPQFPYPPQLPHGPQPPSAPPAPRVAPPGQDLRGGPDWFWSTGRDGVNGRYPHDGPVTHGTEPVRQDLPVADIWPGAARARVRESPDALPPFTSPVRDRPTEANGSRGDARRRPAGRATRDAAARRPWYEVGKPSATAASPARPDVTWPGQRARPGGGQGAGRPHAAPHHPDERYRADGRRHCGSLERVLHRQWAADRQPPAEVVRAVDRLAELPAALRDKLAANLQGIFIGPGGVPDLDDMQHLRGVPLPGGRATWDACAGAYGGRKIIVGARPSPTPDVMCHEIGHALDDVDGSGHWLSDRAEFRVLYEQCVPHLVSDFHKQRGGLGRREFFADAFAAIASRQRPALVDMLGGDTRTALSVMLYFNRRYGI